MKVLVLIWVVVWFFPFGEKVIRRENPFTVPGPFTVSEKILLGYPLLIHQLTGEEWELLPGIGPATAEKIVVHQKQNGPLIHLEELTKIKGIGDKTVAALRRYFAPPSKF